MMTSKRTIEAVAQEAWDAFQSVKRGEDTIYTIKDGSPDWIRDAVYDAHGRGRLLPDDWTYETAMDAFEAIADDGDDDDAGHEFADRVDVYSHDLARWLSIYPNARSAVEEAAAEGLIEDGSGDIDRQLMVGQYHARLQIHAAILQACRDQAEDEDA